MNTIPRTEYRLKFLSFSVLGDFYERT